MVRNLLISRTFPNDILNPFSNLTLSRRHAREQIAVIKLLNSVKSAETAAVYLAQRQESGRSATVAAKKVKAEERFPSVGRADRV